MEPTLYEGYFWQGRLVRLRPYRMEDAPQKWRERTDSEGRLLLEDGIELPPVSLAAYTEAFRPACELSESDHSLSFAIDNLEGEFVGWINVHSRDARHGTFGFGIGIFREHRRRGYAEEATRLVLRYMFRECRYRKCDSACLSLNPGSIALHRRLGFTEEGRQRESVYVHGQHCDRLLFGLLANEFDENDRPHR
jgi:RimJ/RimL family protein N-acetyltransferase